MKIDVLRITAGVLKEADTAYTLEARASVPDLLCVQCCLFGFSFECFVVVCCSPESGLLFPLVILDLSVLERRYGINFPMVSM